MTVVAGVDGSPITERVVKRAIEEAAVRDTALHLVHVFHPPMFLAADAAYDWTSAAAAERKAIWDQVVRWTAGMPIETLQVDLEGYPPDTLVDYCDNVTADLLVMGTRGRGDFASFILGSTSHRAVQLAHCDVLIIRPPAEDE